MRASGYAVKAPGQPLEPFEYETPAVGDADVCVDVSHCGLCHTDIHFMDNDFGLTRYPFVPGHEIVGTVRAMGRAVHGLEEGQRVGIGFQRGSCGHCEWCVKGQENVCPEASRYWTFFPYGGFSRAIVADHRFAFPLSDGLDAEHAGPLLCAGVTVYAPLRRACARGSTRVGVVGIGGLGHLALQFARAMGCDVTAFSSTPAKERQAREFGAHHFVLSSDTEAMKKASASVDFLISTLHAGLPWDSLLGALRKNGVLCLVGLTREEIALKAPSLIISQITVCGSCVGGRADMQEMLEFAVRAGVRPAVETMPMAEVYRAVSRLREGLARYRIVLSR
jgi:alcohol/geraniol dehydrogenase (NADP+)